jgi:hypothetical protein
VARSPAEEDAPPFIDFAYRLWQANTDLEEWHEDLRTLYVACTRPRDYLVLSAALPANYQASGPWMLTLAERFDLTSGLCRADDVLPEHRPAIRVHDVDRPPPAPERTVVKEPLPREDQPVPELPTIPLAGRSARCVSVEELEASLVGPRGHSAEPSEVQRLLERLAAPELRSSLAGAVWHRDVEYLLTLKENLPAVHGRIEVLWQDEDERWHLLFTSGEPISGAAQGEEWKRRQTSLVLAATAIHRQTGTWPRSVTLAFLHDGGTVTRAGGRLPHRSVLAEVERGLGKMAR